MLLDAQTIANYRKKYHFNNKHDRTEIINGIAGVNKKELIPVIMAILDDINQTNLKDMQKILGDKQLLLSDDELKRIAKRFAQGTPLEELSLDSVKQFIKDISNKRMPAEFAGNKELMKLLETDLNIRYISKVFSAIFERQNLIKNLFNFRALIKKLSHLTEQKVRNPLHTLVITAKHANLKPNTESLWSEVTAWIDGLYQSTKHPSTFEKAVKPLVDSICKKKFNMTQDDIAAYDDKLARTLESCVLSFKTKELTHYLQASSDEKIDKLAQFMDQCTLVNQQAQKLNFISQETAESFADYLKSSALTTFDENNDTKVLLTSVINSQDPQEQIDKLLLLDKKFKDQQRLLLQAKADNILLKIFDTLATENKHLKRAAL